MKKFFSILCIFLLFVFIGKTQSKSIVVGVYNNNPKIYIDANGKPQGIFIDVLEEIAKQNNFKILYYEADWIDLVKMLEAGQIDVLPDMAYTKQRDTLFCFNKLFVINSWLEVFVNQNSNISTITDLNNKKIGVLMGSHQEEYLKNQFANDFGLKYELIFYKTYRQTVQGLINGDIDAIVASRFFNFSDEYSNQIHSTGIILQASDLFFAFRKNIDSKIPDAFDKSISKLKNTPNSVYFKSLQYHLDRSIIKKIPKYIKTLLYFLVLFGILVTFFVVLLKFKVDQRTNDLKKLNEELEIAKQQAIESNELKTAFLRNISHEIRTPLNAIYGFSQLLDDKTYSEEKKSEFIDIIKQNSERLINIISDIITIALLEKKQIKLNFSIENINELLNELYEDFKKFAINKNIEFSYILGNNKEETIVYTDIEKISQIFFNLLTNSFKYTNLGKIEFGYIKKDNEIVFFVKDSGSGIKKEYQKKIFERFNQADNFISENYGGIGLGLSICKGYVDLLGGQIWLESEENKGSSFFFTIPLL